jgi:hypothetical protein
MGNYGIEVNPQWMTLSRVDISQAVPFLIRLSELQAIKPTSDGQGHQKSARNCSFSLVLSFRKQRRLVFDFAKCK